MVVPKLPVKSSAKRQAPAESTEGSKKVKPDSLVGLGAYGSDEEDASEREEEPVDAAPLDGPLEPDLPGHQDKDYSAGDSPELIVGVEGVASSSVT